MTVKEFWKLPDEERQKCYKDLSPDVKFGVRVTTPPVVIGAWCNECSHNHMDFTCDAFPDGIPDGKISWANESPPKECARGIGYKPKD